MNSFVLVCAKRWGKTHPCWHIGVLAGLAAAPVSREKQFFPAIASFWAAAKNEKILAFTKQKT